MCNLYRMSKSADELAKWFSAVSIAAGMNSSSEVYPRYPGLIVVDGKLRSMTSGFPLILKSKRTGEPLKPKPVNNARTDKLDSFFWRDSFEARRCLIPLSAWAEAQGPKGGKTRTWMSLPDQEIFACAGVWRDSDEFGHCFSMVMTDSAGSAASDVHSRMPVILRPELYRQWQAGSPEDARTLCNA